ncbi:glycosyl transferase family 10 (putative fucosyltransferase) [Nonlabens dokdonensis]|jgi:hypothetical protein|uniref:Putative LPS biosynthesis related glycosyltransferase n=3 Tax=Nonlabens dokdonensis TaxID=328515 RepID=L7W6U2_NONDD|nr:putative LPS biosynthesis related glycosyltransferase [Nonlabens dokdonensis DSW-6]PZX40921.1 glycosyl transferase family 10 (putative fucosyltransferase) [Nonlabens dokdonensis]
MSYSHQFKEKLKINYVDMWPDFQNQNNIFHQLLSKRYDLEITSTPDFLIYSCFGNEHLKYSCAKLFYTGENQKSNFYACDYAVTFEMLASHKQYYLPYYVLRVIEANKLSQLKKIYNQQEAQDILDSKTQFCCTVVSNGFGQVRNHFFRELNKVKKVNSGGRFENNVGGPVKDKNSFCQQHKFVFAFENEKEKGYCTEKITDALLSNSIPIYFGDPTVTEVFNSSRFLNYDDFSSTDDLIKAILDIDSNDKKFMEILKQPVFKNAQTPDFFDLNHLLDFISTCIDDSKLNTPVSQTYKRHIYWVATKVKNAKNKIRNTLILSNR